MSKPRLLDLFCGAGGAAMGYHRAGFDVVGVDINPRPRYPFEFIQADALTMLDAGTLLEESPWRSFDAIHASPPCQDYSLAVRHLSAPHPRLIADVMARLVTTGRPWVIENVPGAPVASGTTLFGEYGVQLCGSLFGLRVGRHRLFQTSFPISHHPGMCDHTGGVLNPYNSESRKRDGIQFGAMKAYGEAMGIDWMVGGEIGEAIPPAYTEWIGTQLMAHLNRAAAPLPAHKEGEE